MCHIFKRPMLAPHLVYILSEIAIGKFPSCLKVSKANDIPVSCQITNESFAMTYYSVLGCEYLQCVPVFDCVVSISSAFLRWFVLCVFAECFFIFVTTQASVALSNGHRRAPSPEY